MAPLHLSCPCHHHNASKVVQELGADETINYREQDFADIYKDKPFDYIFDSVGGEACFAVRMQHRVLAEMWMMLVPMYTSSRVLDAGYTSVSGNTSCAYMPFGLQRNACADQYG